jgi:hypothetical protein
MFYVLTIAVASVAWLAFSWFAFSWLAGELVYQDSVERERHQKWKRLKG